MRKIILSLLIILSLFVGINVKAYTANYTNENTNYVVVIEDDADLLTDDQETLLLEKMKPLTEHGNIAFKTIESNDTSAKNYANNYYYNNFGNNNGTLFLIDMDNRVIQISSGGSNYKVITTAKANIITDNVYKYASRGDYYNCAYKAFEQIDTLLNNGKIAEPMRYISNVVVALILAFFVNLFLVLRNSSTKKSTNKEVLNGSNITFNVSNIVATKTGQHKVYNPPSSSSSGGSSGGGGGGGGGFSGGGGGHGF